MEMERKKRKRGRPQKRKGERKAEEAAEGDMCSWSFKRYVSSLG